MLEGYEYHLFLSYPRKGDVSDWLHNHLLPVLKRQLESEMGEEPRIFVDTEIDIGDDWTESLDRALHRSCCLLPVWTPQFFRSKWCLAEWQTMRMREEKLGFRSANNPKGLVYPIVFADGNFFPDDAKRVQTRLDFHDYAYPYPQFRETSKYLDFHDRVRQVAQELVSMLDLTPKWDAEWQSCRPEPSAQLNISFRRL